MAVALGTMAVAFTATPAPPAAKSPIDPTKAASDPPPPRLEFPDDPYLRPSPHQGLAGPPSPPVQAGPYVSVQVNVNANGQNIPGDAANEPSLAISPVDPMRLVIGWRQFDNVISNFRQAGRGYSTNGGASWTFNGVFQPGVFRSDPVLESLTDGTFLYNSLQQTFACDMFTSTNGIAWSPPFPVFGGDKLWMTVDKTTGPGRDFVYFAWSTAAGCCGTNIFSRSTDGGLTNQQPVALPNSPVWGTLSVGPDGSLYVCGISGSTYRVLKSTNAQVAAVHPSFPTNIAVNMGGTPSNNTGPNPGGILGQVWIAADRSGGPNNGNVYMAVSCNPSGTDPMDVMFARSTNGGLNWSAPLRINTDLPGAAAWQWFATMSVAPDGRIDIVWNDTRASQQTNLCEFYYSYSIDGGLTFPFNIRISPQWNSFVGWPNQQKIGDYYHCISDNAACNIAYAATFNGEQDVWFLRVGDCNSNGIHDGVEIAAGALDADHNGILDSCEAQPCPADIAPPGGSGVVDIDDLVLVITSWGATSGPADVNNDNIVNIDDLVAVITAWGACP